MGRRRWDTACLDQAFAEPPDGKERRRLVGDLLAGPFQRYARDRPGRPGLVHRPSTRACRSSASTPRTSSATTRSCCCSTSWCSGSPASSATRQDPRGGAEGLQARRVRRARAARADHQLRPPPAGPARPGQQGAPCGNEVTSLFDMLKYWDGRFDTIRLDDGNLPAIVHERLLKPKDAGRTGAARRGLRRRVSDARRPGRPCSTCTASGGPGRVPPHLSVQPGVPARHGGHLRCPAARADRAQADAAAPRRLPGHAAGRPAHAARRDLRRARRTAPTGRSPTSCARSSSRPSGSTPAGSAPTC